MNFRPLYPIADGEICHIIGSRTRVYDLISTGDLRAVKIGRLTAVTGDSLREYIETLPPAVVRGSRRGRSAEPRDAA